MGFQENFIKRDTKRFSDWLGIIPNRSKTDFGINSNWFNITFSAKANWDGLELKLGLDQFEFELVRIHLYRKLGLDSFGLMPRIKAE